MPDPAIRVGVTGIGHCVRVCVSLSYRRRSNSARAFAISAR